MLSSAKGTYDICRCYFNYYADDWYCYILGCSDKFLFGAEENDFQLNGFQIRKISDLKKVEKKEALCAEINRNAHILENINAPDILLSSWYDVFVSLSEAAEYLIVENGYEKKNGSYFYLGKIVKTKKAPVIFSPLDADGIWQDDVELPFSEMTSVTFGDRYSETFGRYAENMRK